mgnify:CR=1 FL=1
MRERSNTSVGGSGYTADLGLQEFPAIVEIDSSSEVSSAAASEDDLDPQAKTKEKIPHCSTKEICFKTSVCLFASVALGFVAYAWIKSAMEPEC